MGDELALAQDRLLRAIARARAGQEPGLAQKVRRRGESAAQLLGGLLRAGRSRPADPRAFDSQLEQLARALGELVGWLGVARFQTLDGQIYLGELGLRGDVGSSARALVEELAKHEVGGLCFRAPPDGAAARALVAALTAKPAGVDPCQALRVELARQRALSVEPAPRGPGPEGEADERRRPGESAARMARLVAEALAAAAEGRAPEVLPLRRAVADLLDGGLEAPEAWEALSDATTPPAHAALVALVAMLVGSGAGLRRAVLQDLGVAALLHDLGYASARAGRGREGLLGHPGEGVRIMLRQAGFGEGKVRRLRAVLDHHRDHAEPRGAPSGLGQMLRLADDYATACRLGAGRVTPADVLGAMVHEAGNAYHPALLQTMINVLGGHPPGTLLELTDGRLARSVSPVRRPGTFATPLVRVQVAGAQAPTPLLDLAAEGGVRRALPG